MKIKESFIAYESGGMQVLASVNQNEFSGIVRSNETAAFIINKLKENVTEQEIVDALLREYDAPRCVVEEDVKTIIGHLKEIKAIEE